MNDALERRLRAIEDVQAIVKLKAAYCDGWDRGWEPVAADRCDRVLELFVENAIWDTSPFARCEGREELRQAFQALASQPLGLHCVTNPDIQVDGDGAIGRWHVALTGNQDGAGFLMIGIYEDKFVRTAPGWRFKSVKFIPACITKLPNEWISGALLQSPPLNGQQK